jgi:hypothetical protein
VAQNLARARGQWPGQFERSFKRVKSFKAPLGIVRADAPANNGGDRPMKLSLQPDHDLDLDLDLDADDVDADDDELLVAAMLDDDDGTTDEVTTRTEEQEQANAVAANEKLPQATLTRRRWKKADLETWKKEVENLASLTFDIEASLRRAHSTATNLGNEIDPIASRAYDAEYSLKQCTSHLIGIDDRLRTLSG